MVTAPPPRSANEWAADKRIFPSSAPVPGPFDPDLTPYTKPLALAAVDPLYDRITAVFGTQMGKSTTFENIAGHRLDEDPTPVMYVAPTKPMIDNTIEPKFMAMVRECESLSRLYGDESTKHTKYFGGVKFRFAWAGSASELAADSAGLVIVDEVDRVVNTGEGDTMTVIEARGAAYANSKTLFTATPVHGRVVRFKHPASGLWHWAVAAESVVSSTVWRLWQSGTRHEWAVPCPHCDEYFVPSSHLIWWPGQGTAEECTPDEAAASARICCPSHGCMIEEKWRGWMNLRGVAIAPGQSVTKAGEIEGEADTAGSRHYTLWVSGIMSFSVKRSLGTQANRLRAAQMSGDPGKLLAVHNTVFGECFAVAGDVPTSSEVRKQCWPTAVASLVEPLKVLCTVDVQKRRLVYVVRAWFVGLGSQKLESGELWGDTDRPDVWDELAGLLDREWYGRQIDMMGVDVGFRDDEVYSFVRAHRDRARALRGQNGLSKPYRKVVVEVDGRGKPRPHGTARWEFESPAAKRWVHSRIGWPEGKPGFWLLPADADVSNDYCEQIVGEEWNEASGKWDQVGENHYLDCEAMQYMLARMLRVDRTPGNALTLNDMRALKRATAAQALATTLASSLDADAAADEVPPTPETPPAEKPRGRFKIRKKRG